MKQQAHTFYDQPLAAIDVGSNTIHLVVGIPRQPPGRRMETLVDELEFVRLGAGVGSTGRIAPERFERGLAVLKRLRDLARQAGAVTILGAATEVMRQANNGPEFLARARAELGLEIALISGDQEAALTFWGATSDRAQAPQHPAPAGEDARAASQGAGGLAVADLGGGSMELVLGVGEQIVWRRSVPLGSGSLSDRFIHADPPAAGELAALRQEAAAFLGALDLPPEAPSPTPAGETPALQARNGGALIVCGGTATTLLTFSWNALSLSPAQMSLSREEVEQAIALLGAQPSAEIAEQYGVEPARAQILGAGASVLAALMDRLGVGRMEISHRGIREGMILSYARHGAAWLEAAG
jgi:exopolyphosphatase/guanosine-5'-triphosphate,3'-diphosphate pyrophosphatase